MAFVCRYYFRLVYASLGPSAYEIANGVDGKIVTDWSAPVTTYSAAYAASPVCIGERRILTMSLAYTCGSVSVRVGVAGTVVAWMGALMWAYRMSPLALAPCTAKART
jgi:hypothetical protein